MRTKIMVINKDKATSFDRTDREPFRSGEADGFSWSRTLFVLWCSSGFSSARDVSKSSHCNFSDSWSFLFSSVAAAYSSCSCRALRAYSIYSSFCLRFSSACHQASSCFLRLMASSACYASFFLRSCSSISCCRCLFCFIITAGKI